ncbi:YceD family protein [Marinobacter sp. 2_MG-2023]|uniref:YceD family protein n=1 Tax=Marinobacter sp. 2_MG-2023 TaxID=3062679 RepID=UPI0026E459FC|nr:YceD family protein [Marinobacter sp. 2_MG-2023]MDO6440691.1 YceD family protein [Marinobacter sp. 2_MG-2023]
MSNASSAELPKIVDPYRLAEHNSVLEGEIPISALSRFRESVLGFEDSAACRVKLSFYQDSERRRIVSGELEAPVRLECQRCMGSMDSVLASTFTLGLVTSDEQAERLPKDLEPFLTADFSADLWSMVEDELLLVLPPYPLHDRNECPAKEDLEAYEPDHASAEAEAKSKDNPFSVLAGLGKTKH